MKETGIYYFHHKLKHYLSLLIQCKTNMVQNVKELHQVEFKARNFSNNLNNQFQHQFLIKYKIIKKKNNLILITIAIIKYFMF